MSDTLRVTWTITLQTPPQPLLHCNRCRDTKNFRTSDRIRLNANGKRVDAWLIYKCTSCENTWNRPIIERQPVGSIDPAVLARLRDGDRAFARDVAFDADGLKRWTRRIEAFDDCVVLKELMSGTDAPPTDLMIDLVVPHPVAMRVDRLLASQLSMPRARIHRLVERGDLAVHLDGPRALRRAVRDGMRLRWVSVQQRRWRLCAAAPAFAASLVPVNALARRSRQ